MNRKEFLLGLGAAGGLLMAGSRAAERGAEPKHARAITMWDFSWLERRWPGAGFEDWDQALGELAARGYDAVRIDAYPHLLAVNPGKHWLLKPKWDTQDWGSPTLVRVRVLPELYEFIAKCRERRIKVGLSSWFREDEDDVRMQITGPRELAEVWNTTLDGIKRAGLLDALLYVDLCNEWPRAPFLTPKFPEGQWADPRSREWMSSAIAAVRREFPELPLLFSTDNTRVEDFAEHDVGFMDSIEHHVWMTGENDDEFYTRVGYNYEPFSQVGFHNVQLKAAELYAQRPAYWQRLLAAKISRLADAARRAGKPLMTTECWAIVDYKDWPLMPWDWVKELCDLGARQAAASGRWLAIATSNFCAPQFRGMWRDVEWHQRLTGVIKSAAIAPDLKSGRLWERL